jgi:translation initiation factor IF-2
MSETKDSADKPAPKSGRKPLSLQRTVESGLVRQNFSHGRSKSVVVEKRRSRKLTPPGAAPAEPEPEKKAEVKAKPAAKTKAAPKKAAAAPPAADGNLSAEERDARNRALEEARKRSAAAAKAEAEKPVETAKPAEAPADAKTENKSPASATAEKAVPAAAKKAASDTTAKAAPKRNLDTARMPRSGNRPKQIEIPSDIPPEPSEVAPKSKEARMRTQVPARGKVEDERDGGDKRGRQSRPTPRSGQQRSSRGRLTINNALDEQQRERSLASLKRKREREKLKAMGVQQPREKIAREVVIPEAISLQDLSNRMSERGVDVIKFLMKQGDMHKITDIIDGDTAELIVTEFGHTAKRVSEADVETGFIGAEDDEGALESRPPVVTIMGHVDHGKTSLLDALRNTSVVSGEAGGITQHIGAYQVNTPAGDLVTFIDTPGHAAFTAMRARGAKVTDLVILVVAADDGVMPQTKEAIEHAKAAEVPLIVAINKIDKPQADPNRVRTELLQHEIVVESMSGDVLEVEVSALKGTNLDKLLEAIQLQAELLDLKANPDRSADGVVVEAQLERGRGPVGTVLVQRGSLAVGDIVVAGTAWGRVRALVDDKGRNTAKAGPSQPVELLGLSSAPEAGDQFAVVENEARAREITDYRLRKRRETLGIAGSSRTLEHMMQQMKEADRKDVPLVIKSDVQGSSEAIAGALKKLGTEEVEARIVLGGVGGITESDVSLANASNAVILGFNVRANVQAKQAADQQGVEIRYYNIIYDLVDDVKAAMSGLLEPTIREHFLGNAEIKEVFNISKVGKVAGCVVSEGKVERGAKVRLIRDNVVIHEGTLSTLKRFKDEVKEVAAGQECGMAFANYEDMRAGDVIECFQVETVQRSL